MNSRTDYRKLAHHHRGLYFVTPSREEVRALPAALLCAQAGLLLRRPASLPRCPPASLPCCPPSLCSPVLRVTPTTACYSPLLC